MEKDGVNPTEVAGRAALSGDGDNSSPSPQIKRKRGRPKGSKNRPKDESGNPVDIPTERVEGEKFRYQYDEKTVKAAGNLLGNLWYFASPFLKVRPLTDDEKKLLGEDAAPLIQKYLPMYDDWKYEINFAMTIVGLYQLAKKDYEAMKQEAEKQND